MRRPSIRTRLALGYGMVMAGVLLVVGVAVWVVHGRLGLARMDGDLVGEMRSLAGVVSNELEERLELPDAARDALTELELPGFGVAILDTDGRLLGTRLSGAPSLPASTLSAAATVEAPHTDLGAAVRLDASHWRSHGAQFRIVAWTPLAPFERERATVRNTILASIPIAMLVAVTGGWLLGWRTLAPLAAMAARADRIDDRRLDERLPIANSRDELGRLGVAFNAVLDRLSRAMHVQRRFMADASHELRTPVSVARTAAQITLDGTTRSEADYRESLTIIEAQMRRLTRIVNDMFLLARADIEARPLERRQLYLDEVLQESVRAADILGRDREIGVALESPQDVAMHGDEALLRHLMMNLLENAVRHTPRGGLVRVRMTTRAASVEIAVEDSGPGIPAADGERVFERFVRLGPAGAAEGAGLGLPIARWIAQQHGGALRLDVQGETSSRFVVTLPLGAPEPAPEPLEAGTLDAGPERVHDAARAS
jgi:heavy metal sensor kinase